MAIKLSTGLRNAVLDTGSVRSELNGGYLHIYSGTPPETADIGKEAGNTLLATIYSNGGSDPGAGGLGFEAEAVDGQLAKASAQTWGNASTGDNGNFATGTATYFLFVGSAEVDGSTIATSASAPRVMGSVGTSPFTNDLVLSSETLTQGVPQTISAFYIYIPV